MRIDVALGPADIELLSCRNLSTTDCVVLDILRASSTIVTALASGASAIFPVSGVDEARALKAADPKRILGGERHGLPPEGFDRGNSPLQYRDIPNGCEIILTTTNGTWAIGRCTGAKSIRIGALLNLAATAQALSGSEDLLLVCAGTFDTPALEDLYAAGALIFTLVSGGAHADLTDSARLVLALFNTHGEAGALECLSQSRNGRAILDRGWNEQIEWCSKFSTLDVVARFEIDQIQADSPAG